MAWHKKLVSDPDGPIYHKNRKGSRFFGVFIVLGIVYKFGARGKKRGNCAEGSHENPTKVKFILKTNVFWS